MLQENFVNNKKNLKIFFCVTLSFGIKYSSKKKSPLMMIENLCVQKQYKLFKNNINFSVCVISN